MIAITMALALALGQEQLLESRAVALNDGVILRLNWIAPGTFNSGDANKPEDTAKLYGGAVSPSSGVHPPREVVIEDGFYLGRTEVTVAQFNAFVRCTGYRTTAERQGFGFKHAGGGWVRVPGLHWQEPGWEVQSEQAVAYVTHEDASAFCRWLSTIAEGTFRLPRGVEWEFACGSGGSAFAVGDSIEDLKRVAHFNRASVHTGPSPVAELEPGPNGLYDMHGNVWEWCLDTMPDNPEFVLLKGGSFRNGPYKLRVAYQPFDEAGLAEPHLGFRVLAEVPIAPSPKQTATDRTSLKAFHYDPDLAEVGRVLHYRHSNVDGTRASRVSLYWAAPDRIESLKWNPGWTRSTLVLAEMDWETFSVASFDTFHVKASGVRTRIAHLETRDGQLWAGGGALRRKIESLPWHSYDFDLSSLNVSLRFRTVPVAPLTFSVADATLGPNGASFGFKGNVEMLHVGDEERLGILCHKYSLQGPGLEQRGGYVWMTQEASAHFVDFEIDLPDEPGMTSGKLTLLESDDLTADQWQDFVRSSVR